MMRNRSLLDVMATRRWTGTAPETLEWLGALLREEGVDLTQATASDLARGTPVYAEAGADLMEIQRLMARNHIRRLPVLQEGKLLGVVDLVEIALRAAHYAGATGTATKAG